MSKSNISYKSLVHFSQDNTPLPLIVGCGICKNRKGRGHGKTKKFKTPRSKYYHIKEKHKTHVDDYIFPTVKEELEELEALSKMNQRGIFN